MFIPNPATPTSDGHFLEFAGYLFILFVELVLFAYLGTVPWLNGYVRRDENPVKFWVGVAIFAAITSCFFYLFLKIYGIGGK